MPVVSDLHRFRTSARYYARGRLAYPQRLIERVVQLTGLPGDGRVLDLGCGPGFLTAAFAPYCREAVGLDPEPAMIAEAEEYARERKARITLRLGSSYDLGPDFGSFHLAVMGRSFHWMNREKTLEALDQLLSPAGAGVLFGDTHLKMAENRWNERFEAILDPYSQKDASSIRLFRDPSALRHEAVLLNSPFARLERISVIERFTTPTEHLIDRALSRSVTSPEWLGERLPEMLEALRNGLREEFQNGQITEVVEFEALMAFRP